MPPQLRNIEIAAPGDDEVEFKLVTVEESKASYEELRRKRRDAEGDIAQTAKSSDGGRKRDYDKMEEALNTYTEDAPMMAEKDASRKKRKLMKGLKIYTGPGRGGSDTSKKFIFEMTAQVREDCRSGKQKQFEKAYRKLLQIIEIADDERRSSNDRYKVDCDVLYGAEEDV